MKGLITTGIFVIIAVFSAHAQHIKGVISSSDGQPAGNVNIIIKELNRGTQSFEDGSYKLNNIPAGTYTLIISSVGVETIAKNITVAEEEVLRSDFKLKEDHRQLAEIVIANSRTVNDKQLLIGKTAIKPMELPQAIASVGEQVIKEQQAQRLSDVVKNVNGVYLGTARASTQETFYARGYSFSSTNMFKNGSRLNTGTMPEVSSLESVEVLKGGAAILYGNVSPGGVMNMVTKKPKFHFGGEASMRVGSFNLLKPAVDFYGPISKKIAYRLNATLESTDSYRDQVSSKRYYVNPSFLFKLSEKTELILEGDYLKHDFTPDFGIGSLVDSTKGFKASEIADVPRSRFMGTSWQYNVSQQATTSLSLKHALHANWHLNSVLSYQLFDRDYFAVERIQADINEPNRGDWKRPLGRVDSREHYYTAQVNLNGKFKTAGIGHTLLAGVDADHYITETYNYDIQGKIYDTVNILQPGKFTQRTDIPVANRITSVHTPVNRFGAYLQDLISISAKLKLLAGIRWSMQETVPPTTTYLTKDSTARGKKLSDAAFSPRVGIVYRFKPTVSVFASYSNSFAINNGLDIYNNVLPASIIDQYELGIKNIMLQGKLTVNVTAYKIINSNLAQTAQFDKDGNVNNNSNLKELSGQTTSNGLELDITGEFGKALSLMAGYSYNDMRYSSTPDKQGSYVEGDRLVNTPAHTANASAFYRINTGRLKGLKLGAGVHYVGERFGGWNNTIGQAQNYSRLIPVSAFTTLDLSAGYSFKKFSVLAKLANATNTLNYYVHENYSINPIAPTSFVATVAYKF